MATVTVALAVLNHLSCFSPRETTRDANGLDLKSWFETPTGTKGARTRWTVATTPLVPVRGSTQD